jgi:hypothetical protein
MAVWMKGFEPEYVFLLAEGSFKFIDCPEAESIG